MIASSLTEKSTSALLTSRACGTGQSQSDRLEVSTSQSTCYEVPHLHPDPEAFAATGWRIGWLIGPKYIIQPTLAATTRIVFCSNSPMQEAVAAGLEQVTERKFFETQRAEYEERRAILCEAFDKLGLKYTLPEGSYFILLVGPHIINH